VAQFPLWVIRYRANSRKNPAMSAVHPIASLALQCSDCPKSAKRRQRTAAKALLFDHFVGGTVVKVRAPMSREVPVDGRGNRCGAIDKMRRAVLLLVVITLGGCLPDQSNDVAACRIEADRFYQARNAADVDNPKSQYIIACMAAKGYDFTISPAN
jgi:hypothetical protein